MLINTDISYLISALSSGLLFYWLSCKVTLSRKESETLWRRLTSWKNLYSSSKSLGNMCMFISLGISCLVNGLTALLKYHFGYIQVPYSTIFLQRPYESWMSKAGGIYLLEVLTVLSELVKYLGIFLYLTILYNASLLVAPVLYTLPDDSNCQDDAKRLKSLKQAYFVFAFSVLFFVLFLLIRKISSPIKYLVCSMGVMYWIIKTLLLIGKIKVTLVRILESLEEDGDGEGNAVDASGKSNLNTIPSFRVREQLSSLNCLMFFLVQMWTAYVIFGGCIGELYSVFWLDVLQIIYTLGSCCTIVTIIELIFPGTCYNYATKLK